MPSHPRVRARGTPPQVPIGEMTRAISYIPDVFHEVWIESELALLHISMQISRNVEHLVAALVDDPPPRPQLLFIDLEALSGAELLELCSVRERGWFGTVFAVGMTPLVVRQSLNVERVLQPPLSRDLLRAALLGTTHAQLTTPIRRVTG